MKPASPQVAAAKLLAMTFLRPKLAIILGTGFNRALASLKPQVRIDYNRIPGFPALGVEGHAGEILFGCLANHPVLLLSGRAHFYEGHPMSVVTFAVRTLAAFGIQALLLTNAAGAINPKLRRGDFMALKDHINFMGENPLRGSPGGEPTGFVDLSEVYDAQLRRLLVGAARECGVRLRSGIYIAVRGPSYETPAEINAFHRWGADAVGMSTVPEAMVARQCGLRVAALSLITNLAAGRNQVELSHKEVLEAAALAKKDCNRLLESFVGRYAALAEVSD
ncbi:MAG TPA: purine-nucleoside phosphorylase [Verrucomicrobiae bacterium]|nr:purine-nucleoside phosphorylase [Verrucomicrobiae bacterium]